MKVYFVIATLFKLTMAIATLGNQNLQDELTTLPTELFKPLLPVTEQSTVHQIAPLRGSSGFGSRNNGHNVMGEEYGSASQYNHRNYNDVDDVINAIRGPSGPLFSVQNEGYEHSISGLQPNNNPSTFSQIRYTSPSFYNMFSNSRSHQQDQIPTGSYQFSITGNHFPTVNLHDGTDINSRNGHYRYSSSSTYYNSNAMEAPETHGIEYDSRNGGFEFK